MPHTLPHHGTTTLFQQFRSDSTGVYSYLLGDCQQHVALIIDPVAENQDVLLAAIGGLGLDLAHILMTHLHPNAADWVCALRERTGANVVVSAACGLIEADLRVAHGGHLIFGNEVIHVIGTPGHTLCSVSFRWRDRVFTGDTLLLGGCGHVTLPGGDAGQLFDSVIERLFMMPPETLVFPAYDPNGRTVSTIAEEKATNPLFSCRNREAFVNLITEKCEPIFEPLPGP